PHVGAPHELGELLRLGAVDGEVRHVRRAALAQRIEDVGGETPSALVARAPREGVAEDEEQSPALRFHGRRRRGRRGRRGADRVSQSAAEGEPEAAREQERGRGGDERRDPPEPQPGGESGRHAPPRLTEIWTAAFRGISCERVPAMTEVVLAASRLTKRFGRRVAVADVSFEVYAGEVF